MKGDCGSIELRPSLGAEWVRSSFIVIGLCINMSIPERILVCKVSYVRTSGCELHSESCSDCGHEQFLRMSMLQLGLNRLYFVTQLTTGGFM